jgi:hypothetical protein
MVPVTGRNIMAIPGKSTLGTFPVLIALALAFTSCYSDGHYRITTGFEYGRGGSYDLRYHPRLGYPSRSYRYPYSTFRAPGSRFRHYQRYRGRHFPPSFHFRYYYNRPYHYYPFRR